MTGLESFGPFVNLGGWLLIVFIVTISMIRGWLYSSTQVDRIITSYDKLLIDKDQQISDWREAYKNSDARGDILADNQRELLESVKTTNSLIQALSTYYPPLEKREQVK